MADLMTNAKRRSPFSPYHQKLSLAPDGMRFREIPFLAQVSIRAAEPLDGLPVTPNTFHDAPDDGVVAWLGPDEWLAVADCDPGELLGRFLLGEVRGAVVDVSGQRTVLELAGERARDLLSHGCALDISAAAAPTGTSLTTLLAQAGITLLVRDDGTAGNPPVFWLLVRSSFARYVAQWVEDASMEYRLG